MISILIFAVWFFIPAGVANVVPILVAKMPFFEKYSYPLDFYKKWNKKRILGDHKTIRGILTGIFMAILIAYLQFFLMHYSKELQHIMGSTYVHANPFFLGLLLGSGALIGDALKSIVKRQMNIVSGNSWFPFDQIDYIIGGLLFIMFYVPISFVQSFSILIMWFIIHLFSSFIGYLIKLKKKPI